MPGRRVFLGLIAVTVGLTIFLDRVGGVDQVLPILRRWWPVLLILLGLGNLIRLPPRPWGVIGPVTIIAVGACLLLVTFGFVRRSDFPRIWPAALAVAGYVIALAGADWPDERLPYQNELRQFVFLRGKRVVSQAPEFWRADITVFFGSFVLDLRNAGLYRRVVVNVNAVFGSVDVIVGPGITITERRPFLLDRFGVESQQPNGRSNRLTINLLGIFAKARGWNASLLHPPSGPPSEL